MLRKWIAGVVLSCLAQIVQAECAGKNLTAQMDPAALGALQARTDSAPFAQGNFWQATRGDQQITIIGTYHLDDPRHDATLAVIGPLVASAQTVLVEAGPEEEAALKAHLTQDPSAMLITQGPSLMQQLPPEDWTRLAAAMAERQVPAFMVAKFQPWYVSVLLAIPPCAVAQLDDKGGLDFEIMRLAEAAQVPVRGMEPYDTVLHIFGQLSAQEQVEMVQNALLMDHAAADMAVTLADAYFAQNSRLIWEFMRDMSLTLPGYTPERVEREFAVMEEALMNGRNRNWIPVLEQAAAEGPVFAAFGALHLSGEEGVLNLLAKEGWALERLNL
jgi:uncharacterized protein